MLPKQYRLPLRTELFRIKREGRLFPGRIFSLLVVNRKTFQPSRFAFIVSTKIHPKASKRNRLRRLLAEAVFSLLPELKNGFEAIFLVKKAILGKKLTEITQETEKIFQQAGIK